MISHPAVAALTIASLAAAARATPPLAIPSGPPPVIDGTIDAKEWSDATVVSLDRAGTMHIKRDGAFVFLGIRGPAAGWAHVCVPDGDAIRVLHASASLGAAVYRRDGGAWRRTQAFAWALNGAGTSPEAVLARGRYLEEHAWVASTNDLGQPDVIEYRIDLSRFAANPLPIAVVFATEAETTTAWPAQLDDGSRSIDLIFGDAPATLRFEPSTWATLHVSPSAAPDANAEIEDVIRTAYVEGVFVNRDEAAVRTGFHPGFIMHVNTPDRLIQATLDMWLDRMQLDGTRNPKPVEARFLDFDVSGDTATVTLELFEDGVQQYTDMLGLYRFPEGWRIVNKLFHAHAH